MRATLGTDNLLNFRSMWGNTLGWIISIVLLAGMILGLRAIDNLRQISPPTDFGKDPNTLAKLALPVSPATVVPMNDPQDAGPIYRQAIEDYLAHQAQYEDVTFAPTSAKEVKGVELILAATPRSAMKLFSPAPDEIVTVKPDKPQLTAIDKLGTMALQIALRQKNPADAKRYAGAVFALGAKLFNERLTVEEMEIGLRMMRDAGAFLESRQPRQATRTAVEEFNHATAAYYSQHIEPVLRVLMSIDPQVVGQHPGDYFFIARDADERVWRVAAIFALGRLRYFAGEGGSLGDQRGASKVLAELTHDSDSVITTAAKAALQMTPQQYQMQR